MRSQAHPRAFRQFMADEFGIDKGNDDERYRKVDEILRALWETQAANRDAMTGEMIQDAARWNWSASGAHRVAPLVLALVNLFEGRNIFNAAPLKRASLSSKEHPLLRPLDWLSGGDPKTGRANNPIYVEAPFPTADIPVQLLANPPPKAEYRWLDIGSAPKNSVAPTLNLLRESFSSALPDRHFQFFGTDLFFPRYQFADGKIEPGPFSKTRAGAEAQVNGVTYLDAREPENNVMSEQFQPAGGRFDFITLIMTLHHLKREGEPEERLALSRGSIQTPDGTSYAEKYPLVRSQQEAIDRLLANLNPGGILFLNLSLMHGHGTTEDGSEIYEANSDTFVLLQKRQDGKIVIYPEVMPFRPNEEIFDSIPSLVEPNAFRGTAGLKELFPRASSDWMEKVKKLFRRADFLAYRTQRLNHSVWEAVNLAAQAERGQQAAGRGGNLSKIVSAYLQFVPDSSARFTNEILREAGKLDEEYHAAGASSLGDVQEPWQIRLAQIDLKAAPEVLSQYNIGKVTDISLDLGGLGEHGRSLLVKTESGKKYVLKPISTALYPELEEGSRYEVSVVNELVRQGWPAAPLIRSTKTRLEKPEDAYWVQGNNGKNYLLYEFVDGQKVEYGKMNSSQFNHWVDTLAEMHHDLKDFAPEGKRTRSSILDFLIQSERLQELRENVLKKRRDNPAYQFSRAEQFFLDQIDFILEQISILSKNLPQAAYDNLPKTQVHGDYHPGNAIFRGERIAAIFDWDHLRREARISDFFQGMFPTWTSDGHYNLDDLARVLTRYQQNSKFEASEIVALPEMARLKYVDMLTWLVNADKLSERYKYDLSNVPSIERALAVLDRDEGVFRWFKSNAAVLYDLDQKIRNGDFQEVVKKVSAASSLGAMKVEIPSVGVPPAPPLADDEVRYLAFTLGFGLFTGNQDDEKKKLARKISLENIDAIGEQVYQHILKTLPEYFEAGQESLEQMIRSVQKSTDQELARKTESAIDRILSSMSPSVKASVKPKLVASFASVLREVSGKVSMVQVRAEEKEAGESEKIYQSATQTPSEKAKVAAAWGDLLARLKAVTSAMMKPGEKTVIVTHPLSLPKTSSGIAGMFQSAFAAAPVDPLVGRPLLHIYVYVTDENGLAVRDCLADLAKTHSPIAAGVEVKRASATDLARIFEGHEKRAKIENLIFLLPEAKMAARESRVIEHHDSTVPRNLAFVRDALAEAAVGLAHALKLPEENQERKSYLAFLKSELGINWKQDPESRRIIISLDLKAFVEHLVGLARAQRETAQAA
ncbi:MAG: phosphotransferase [Candidatus Omnitrophica bacterium]|nr:phosphotransferase [Candidatus Omnitrophota bacterium]